MLKLVVCGEGPVGLTPTLTDLKDTDCPPQPGGPWSFSGFPVLTLQAGSKSLEEVFPGKLDCGDCKLVGSWPERDI